jgi:hypothetical protein
MMDNRWDVPSALKEFNYLLKKYPDHPKFLLVFTNFIRQFLRCKVGDGYLPTVEVMTVLKHEKPIIFTLLRQQQSNTFAMLTYIEIEHEKALERLKKMKSSSPYC